MCVKCEDVWVQPRKHSIVGVWVRDSNSCYSTSSSLHSYNVLLMIVLSSLTCSLAKPSVLNIQDLKNIKNVKRCRDGMPKSMQTR